MDQIRLKTKSVRILIKSAEESGKERCYLTEQMEENQIPGVVVAGQRRTSCVAATVSKRLQRKTPVIRVSSQNSGSYHRPLTVNTIA